MRLADNAEIIAKRWYHPDFLTHTTLPLLQYINDKYGLILVKQFANIAMNRLQNIKN
jgi:hypothetical protein